MKETHYFIGLMSGTSVDAVDAALVNIDKESVELIDTLSYPIYQTLKSSIHQLYQNPVISLQALGELNVELGILFSDSVNALLKKAEISAQNIVAIGSHGQTVFHSPNSEFPFSMQLGDPNVIAARTGITTVADFRNKDIALGGQGAPFAPLFHAALFRSAQKNRCVVNIGGISNITILPADFSLAVTGFDTGPGNTLMDLWTNKHLGTSHDQDGAWAATGKIIDTLFEQLIADDFFKQPPPKSTGREYFSLRWLEGFLNGEEKSEDVQRTLVELTCHSIADAIKRFGYEDAEIIVCGGGVHNVFLFERLRELCGSRPCLSSAQFDMSPDWIEAMMFAYLAKKTIHGEIVDLGSITGSQKGYVLGGIYT